MSSSVSLPDNINQVIMTAVNAVIQSPAVQGYTFYVASGCKASVLNDMYFCDAASASGSYEIPITPAAHTDVPATSAHWDVSGTHTDDKSHADIPKIPYISPHSDSHPHTDIGVPHSDSSSTVTPHMDEVIPGTSTTSKYYAALTELSGMGSVAVTAVTNITLSLDASNLWTFSCNVLVPAAKATAAYSVQQTPLPAMSGSQSVTVNDTTGSATGTLYLVCPGTSSKQAPGYYITINELSMQFPTGAFDSVVDDLENALKAVGISTGWIESAEGAIRKELDSIQAMLSKQILGILNGLLDSMVILPANCPPEHTDSSVPHGDIPAQHSDAVVTPHTDLKVSGIHTDIPKVHSDVAAVPHMDTPPVHTDVTTS